MAYPTDMDLDSLFFDEDEMMLELPSNPPEAPFPFASFPAELRNMVYECYFEDYAVTNNVLKIKATGEMPSPPIINVSKQMRAETIGYVKSCIQEIASKESLAIKAQVKDYDFTPLQNRLTSLSNGDDMIRGTLCKATTVTFSGAFNLSNIAAWMSDPMFFKQSASFRDASTSMFDVANYQDYYPTCWLSGFFSLVSIVNTFRCTPDKYWKSCAVGFLAEIRRITNMYQRDRSHHLLRGAGIGLVAWKEVDSRSERDDIFVLLIEVVGRWHHHLRTVAEKGEAGNVKVGMAVRQEVGDMEMAVWQFVSTCYRIEGIWRTVR